MSIRKLDSSAPVNNAAAIPGIKKKININSGNTPESNMNTLNKSGNTPENSILFDTLMAKFREKFEEVTQPPIKLKKKIECHEFNNPTHIKMIKSLEQSIIRQCHEVQKSFKLIMHEVSFDIYAGPFGDSIGYVVDVVVDGVPHKTLNTDNTNEKVFFFDNCDLLDVLKYAVNKYSNPTTVYDSTNDYNDATKVYSESLESFIKYVNNMDVTLINPDKLSHISDLFNDAISTLAIKQKSLY